MQPALYFIYDSHCPWSYASTSLVNTLTDSFTEMSFYHWHCAHYNGSDAPGFLQIKEVEKQSGQNFGETHMRFADSPKNSTLSANFMAWLQSKQPEKVLPVLTALQHEHFVEGNPFGCKNDFSRLITQFKLSPSNKVFKDKLSNEALYQQSDIQELQAFMQTSAFPALLLTYGDNAVLLEHARYLQNHQGLVKEVKKLLG